MAIGDTVRPELLRTDSSGILRGGLAAGQFAERGLSALGEGLSEGIGKYFEGKQEKKMAESMAENPIALDVVYGGGDMPADAKERIKDMRGVMKASGGYKNFIQRMENLEMKTQNQAMQDQLMALREEQILAARFQQDLREEDQAAIQEFGNFAFTSSPGELPPDAQREKDALRRFDPRSRDFASASDLVPGQVIDPSAFVDIARRQSALESTRGPDQPAPITQPSAQFMERVAGADLSPRAGMKAYQIAQQKATAEWERKKAGRILTEGEKARDRVFGNEIADYYDLGGTAGVDRNIKTLENVIVSLTKVSKEGADSLSGPEMALLPDVLRNFINAPSIATRDNVESVIQQNLRVTLGAQFAAREGEMFLKRGYNENLPEAENIKRVAAVLKEIKDRAKIRRSRFDYFEQMGTLKGFERSQHGTAADDDDDVVVTEAAKSEALRGLAAKAEAGEPLTPKEQQVLDAWEAGQGNEVPKPPAPAPSSNAKWLGMVGSGTGWGPKSFPDRRIIGPPVAGERSLLESTERSPQPPDPVPQAGSPSPRGNQPIFEIKARIEKLLKSGKTKGEIESIYIDEAQEGDLSTAGLEDYLEAVKILKEL